MSLLPFVTFLLHIALSKAQLAAVECISDGECTRNKGRCEVDSIEACYPYSGLVLNNFFSSSPLGNQIFTGDCSNSGNHSDIRLHDLTVKYVSVNPRYVSICVSWSLTESSGSRGGYKIEFARAYRQPVVFCMDNSNHTSLCLNNIGYQSLQFYQMTVKVLPHPLGVGDDKSRLGISQALRTDIRGCVDVESSHTGCVKRYGKPQNLSVLSTLSEDGTKNLSISWNHVKETPTPDTYFVELYDGSRKFLNTVFKVVHATQIDLTNLEGDMKYIVRVQAYRRCAGLGVYDFDPDTLGCGRGRRKLEESVMG